MVYFVSNGTAAEIERRTHGRATSQKRIEHRLAYERKHTDHASRQFVGENSFVLDLANAAGEPRYREAGLEILTSLATHYTSRDHPEEEGILLHATGAKPLGREIDVSLTYGDYYFVEGLLRILEPEKLSRAIGLGGEA